MPRSSRLRWSVAVPLLVLAGLFGMHGLSAHGVGHAAAPVEHGTYADHTGHSMAMQSADAPTLDLPALDLPALSGPTDHGAAAMAGLCLAVLLGGIAAWALLRATRRRTPWALPRLTTVTRPTPRGRDPDPPTPVLLSVCRC